MSSAETRTHRLHQSLNLLIEIPAVVVTFAMIAHVSANAILRTWWNAPVANTLEIVTYWYLPIIALLGFIAAAQRGQHIAADLVYRLLPPVTKKFVLAILFLVSSIVCFGFAYFGMEEAMHAKDIGKTAGVSGVIAWPVYFLVPFAFGSLTLQFLYTAVRALRHPEHDHFVADTDDAAVLDDLAAHAKPSR